MCFSEEIGVPEPEPVPVVERSVRSREEIPVTFRTSSSSSKRQIQVRHIQPFPIFVIGVYFRFALTFF